MKFTNVPTDYRGWVAVVQSLGATGVGIAIIVTESGMDAWFKFFVLMAVAEILYPAKDDA